MYRFLSLALALALSGCGQAPSPSAPEKSTGKLLATSGSNSITTSVSKIVSQPNMTPLSSSYRITGIQAPDLETTAGTNSTITISDGITGGRAAARSLADTITVSDGAAKALHATRALADTITITDGLAGPGAPMGAGFGIRMR